MAAKRKILKEDNLETYIFTNKRPQPNRICGQIDFTPENKNKQYISQDDGGSHLGFMYEQDLKVMKNVGNYFLIKNSYTQTIDITHRSLTKK